MINPKTVSKLVSNRMSHTYDKFTDNRGSNAAALGLTSLTTEGSCALVVATHVMMPSVVIKVVYQEDAFVNYAKAILDGELTGELFPKVYSVTHHGDKVMIALERVEGVRGYIDYEMFTDDDYVTLRKLRSAYNQMDTVLRVGKSLCELGGCIPDKFTWLNVYHTLKAMPKEYRKCAAQMIRFNANWGYVSDCHSGNVIYNLKDKTFKLIDPVFQNTQRRCYPTDHEEE